MTKSKQNKHLEKLRGSVLNQFGISIPTTKQTTLQIAHGIINKSLNISNKSTELIYPTYPSVSSEIAAKLFLNQSVGIGLTKKERHLWLTDGATQTPIEWLLRGTKLEARSISVARWLLKVLGNPEQKKALYKLRREGRLSDHTIDLLPSDCEFGVNEAVARRNDRMAIKEFGEQKLCDHPKWLKTLGGRVRLLDTAVALQHEGVQMASCVGGYANQVKKGSCFIASISAWGHRATVEYSPEKQIVQIKAKANQQASALCVHLANLAVKKG